MNKVINYYYYYGFQIFIEAGNNVLSGHVFCPQCYLHNGVMGSVRRLQWAIRQDFAGS